MNEINIRKAVRQQPVNKSVELVCGAIVVKTKKYPNRSRVCVACNHKCARVDILSLETKNGTFLLEFGEDCRKRFLGKKSKKTRNNLDGFNKQQYTVVCSNKDCSNMNLKSRCRFNSLFNTRNNSVNWFINPYVCDSCDRITNPNIPILIERQNIIEKNYMHICRRFGKNINPIDNSTFKINYINYVNSNFNINHISSIMLLLDNISKYPMNNILLHKFIVYYIGKSRDDKNNYNTLQFLPRKLINWWIEQDWDFILTEVLGIKKCLIEDDDD
jgi:hypothetical protein